VRARVLQVGPSPTDVLLRSPVNWPLASIAAITGVLHLLVAALYLPHAIWTAVIAGVMGAGFLLLSVLVLGCQRDVEISMTRGLVRTRRGIGPFARQHVTPVAHIHAVRLTQIDRHGRHQSRIELLSERGNISCPTTDMPRQQALLMAMTLNVQLIKIWQSSTPTHPAERVHELFQTE
jgi:hypothetical protein